MIIGVADSHPGDAAFLSPRGLFKCAVTVEPAEGHVRNRLIGAYDEDVENRQHTVEVLLLQIEFHVFGDEVGRVERGLHCVFQIPQRAGEVGDAQRIRWRSH